MLKVSKKKKRTTIKCIDPTFISTPKSYKNLKFPCVKFFFLRVQKIELTHEADSTQLIMNKCKPFLTREQTFCSYRIFP